MTDYSLKDIQGSSDFVLDHTTELMVKLLNAGNALSLSLDAIGPATSALMRCSCCPETWSVDHTFDATEKSTTLWLYYPFAFWQKQAGFVTCGKTGHVGGYIQSVAALSLA